MNTDVALGNKAMLSDATISVVIPCYNSGSYLKKCLESIASQTVKPSEVIVVDDGSPDDISQIVLQFQNTKLLKHLNSRGIGETRNSGIHNTTGDVVIFFDADTIVDKNCIENMLSCLNEEIVGVGGCAFDLRQEDLVNRWRAIHRRQTWGENVREDVPFLWGICSCYKRIAFKKVGYFDAYFREGGEDVEMGYRIRKHGYKLGYNPQAIVHHQRQDRLLTLFKMVYKWDYWGFLAVLKNDATAVKTCLEIAIGNFQTWLAIDYRKGIRFAVVTIPCIAVTLTALLRSFFTFQTELRHRE